MLRYTYITDPEFQILKTIFAVILMGSIPLFGMHNLRQLIVPIDPIAPSSVAIEGVLQGECLQLRRDTRRSRTLSH